MFHQGRRRRRELRRQWRNRPDRFRCCICWEAVSWGRGCCDWLDRQLTASLTFSVWSDDRNPEMRVSDGSICDDCWGGMGAADEATFDIGVTTHAEALQ